MERFIRSLKDEALRRILLPLTLRAIEAEIDAYFAWYCEHRPHQSLGGVTPAEVLALPRLVTRRPRAPPKKRRVRPVRLVVSYVEGRPHLPIVELRRPA